MDVHLLTVGHCYHIGTYTGRTLTKCCLWSPYGIGQTTIFPPCGFFFLSSFFSLPNLSGRRLDVYHTSTHGVAVWP